MLINLNRLPVNIDNEFIIPESFYENMDIISMDKVKVTGRIIDSSYDDVIIDLLVEGNITLKDAITTNPIDYPFSIKITENLSELEGESEKYLEKSQNTLDIIEFLWENIVLEVPISKTLASGKKMQGDGWELNGDAKGEEIDPRMQKLSEIYKGGE